jgi:hypothetical protein
MPSHGHYLDARCGGILFASSDRRLEANMAESLGVGRYQPPESYISINGRDGSRELAWSHLVSPKIGSQASRDLPTGLIICYCELPETPVC